MTHHEVKEGWRTTIQDKIMIFLLRVIVRFNLGGEYTAGIRDTLAKVDKNA